MYNENYYNTTGPGAFPSCASTAGQCPCSYAGCMDPNMQYYDPQATCDDGSCVGWVVGCMDPNSFNYSPTATQDDGSCIAKVFGCTTANAHNFDPSANTDDGSCIAKIGGCSDPMAYNYNQSANRDCNDNPIGGGGNNQQAFSGYSNAAGRRRVTVGPSGRTSAEGMLSRPPIWPRNSQRGTARMNEGWEVDGDIYRGAAGSRTAGWTTTGVVSARTDDGSGRGRYDPNDKRSYGGWTNTGVVSARTEGRGRYDANPNAYSYLPPMPPQVSGRYGEYNPDVPITNRGYYEEEDTYRNLTERHHLKPQKRSSRGANHIGIFDPMTSGSAKGMMSRPPIIFDSGKTRMNEGWEVDGDIYRGAAGRQRVKVGPPGRTAGWDVDGDIYRGKYKRNTPVNSRAISSEWNWPY